MSRLRLFFTFAIASILLVSPWGVRHEAVPQEKPAAAKPQIVAAGAAIYTRPEVQDNETVAPVKLPADVASRLGEDHIVLLTMRSPVWRLSLFQLLLEKERHGV